jgi:serpin B
MKRIVVLFCLFLGLTMPTFSAAPSDQAPPADVRTVVEGNNAFALDLYARLREKEGNLFYSPYSISTALAMTYAGARGETAKQMAGVLHFSLDSERLHPAFAELIRSCNGHGLPRDVQLNVAQSLWGDATMVVNRDFQDLLRANYGARLRLVDFEKQSEAARRQINRWVENRTNDRIKELLHSDDIDPMTRMVLVNAIYFKAAWQKPFKKEATEKDVEFHAAGKKVKVAMMHQTDTFNYTEGEDFQAVELPYEGGDVSMVVLLPRAKDGLAKLEQSLTPAKLDGWLAKPAPRVVKVALPRFRVEARFQLGDRLKAMGMSLAFSPGADFSGISSSEKLMISKVIHQAFVDVNEEETEAAAATAVVFTRGGGPKEFRADHPFLFLVRDRQTGTILFLGRVTDPSTTASAKE